MIDRRGPGRGRGRGPHAILLSIAVILLGAAWHLGIAGPAEPLVPATSPGWAGAIATAHERPARVVVISDSIGELQDGWGSVWRSLHGELTGSPVGGWSRPRFGTQHSWHPGVGRPVEAGLDLRGVELVAGMAATGSAGRTEIPTTLDVYYTARPGGATVEVRIRQDVVAEIDTSSDEHGRPVTSGVARAQRWRSSPIGGPRSWSLTAVDDGTAIIESVAFPPERGIEFHGKGRSGASTRELLDSRYPVDHLAAMTARGEPPDLVVWAADTADSDDLDAHAADLAEAFIATRAAAPGATIAHYVPTGHNKRDWAPWAEMYRRIDAQHGVLVIDGYAALGDVSTGADPRGYGADGVHLNAAGRAELDQVFLRTLRTAAGLGDPQTP